jgi:hypothetical protein
VDRPIPDHATAQRAQFGHLKTLFSRLRFNSRNPSKHKPHPQTHAPTAASAASSILKSQQDFNRTV